MATPAPTLTVHRSPWPRWTNIGLGSLLMLSALVLPHGSASRINALVVGGLVIAAAAWGLRREVGRLTSTLLAVWLGLSAILLPASTAAISVNLMAAVSILVVSLLPGGADLERRRQPTEITASTAS